MIKIHIEDYKNDYKTVKTLFFECENFLEFASYARVKGLEKTYAGQSTRKSFYGKQFSDCVSFNVVSSREQKALEDKLTEKLENITYEGEENKYNVCGNDLDVGRYLAGEQECFFDDYFEVKESKKVLIKVNMSIPYYKKTGSITERAIAIMALYEHFRRGNIAVDIEFCDYGEYHLEYQPDDYEGLFLRIGPMADPPKKLLFNALTGSFYRRINHAYLFYFSRDKWWANGSCGEVYATDEEQKKYDNIVVFKSIYSDYLVEGGLIDIVKNGLREKVTYIG